MIRIILISLLLSGCGITGAIKVKTDLTCYWHEKITADEETKAWMSQLGFSEEKISYLESHDWESWDPAVQEIMTVLLTRDDWPKGFKDFMEQVGDDNQLHSENCPE